FSDGCPLNRATEAYWRRFIDERRNFIGGIEEQHLKETETHERVQALKSLQRARFQLETVDAEDCTAFLEAWREDRRRLTSLTRRPVDAKDYADAFATLELEHWQEARFGVARMLSLA